MNPNRASTTVPTEGWFRCLARRGLEPVLVSHQAGAFDAWARQQGIATYHIPMPPPNKLNPWLFLWSLWRLSRIVQRHHVQLVHCNEQDIYPTGQYLARMCRLPVAVSIHCRMTREFSRWAFAGARRPQRMLFVSRANLAACRPGLEGVVDEVNWAVIHNGLDLASYRPDSTLRATYRKQYGGDSDRLIGVACALRPGKQVEHLMAAVSALSIPRLRVLVAGGTIRGYESYAANLIETAQATLGDRVRFLGHVDDLRGFMNGLDLFVNTSQEEAFGICALEALACGCPVVGYPSGAVEEVVLPEGGEIVDQDHTEQLAMSLTTWLSDPARLTAARERARLQAERFNIERVSEQLWGVYESLLANDSCGPHGSLWTEDSL